MDVIYSIMPRNPRQREKERHRERSSAKNEDVSVQLVEQLEEHTEALNNAQTKEQQIKEAQMIYQLMDLMKKTINSKSEKDRECIVLKNALQKSYDAIEQLVRENNSYKSSQKYSVKNNKQLLSLAKELQKGPSDEEIERIDRKYKQEEIKYDNHLNSLLGIEPQKKTRKN